jgi:murein DD-endopeptidase MepM/ murein hydrolase activator NlpD
MANKRFFLLTLLLAVLAGGWSVADEQVHVLQRGETIYTLARRYDVRADQLLQFNGITDPTRLAVGTRIRIPGSYVVREGEYIFSIARRLGVGWLDLLEANGLDRNDVVRPGDVLMIPGAAAASTATESTPPADPDDVPPETTAEPPDDADEAPVAASAAWPHPGARQSWNGKFPGVVMSGEPGDQFRSVTDGLVEFVGPFSSFGKLILVRSANGYLYGYAGADRVLVSRGQRVDQGTILGTVGFSPAFDSAMVLFTVWRNNRYVDPETAPRG